MKVLGIDPGTTETAWVIYESTTGAVLDKAKEVNELVHQRLVTMEYEDLAIEMMQCFGMAIGYSVLETCVWIGRFMQTAEDLGHKTKYIYRKGDVCSHLCHSGKASDSNVRRAVMDRYGATGGGKTPEVGTKKVPGPLYGVAKDMWSALAIAITYHDKYIKGIV